MAYTYAQLTKAYAAVHGGIEPTGDVASQLQLLTNASFSDADRLSYILNSADDSTAVAVLSYQFFTGKSPSAEGIAYLLNSVDNRSDLNDPVYARFNLENRFMNFATNLALQGQAKAEFEGKYGTMSYAQYVASIYETIIGKAQATAAGLNPEQIIQDIIGRQDLILQSARNNGVIGPDATQAEIDLALKAATAAYLLAEGIKADVGVYAAATNNLMLGLAKGDAVYGSDITQTYAPNANSGSTGLGQAVDNAPALPVPPAPPRPDPEPEPEPEPTTPPAGRTIVLKAEIEEENGSARDDTFVGTDLTFSDGDTLNGRGGHDTLTLTATPGAGSGYGLPNDGVTGIETINITSNGGVNAYIPFWTDVTELNVTAGEGPTYLTTTTGAKINATVTAPGANTIGIDKGSDVTLKVTGATTGAIRVGSSEEPTGDVVVSRELVGDNFAGAITVSGGKTVSITQTAATLAGQTQRNGLVTVNGSALTTEVTVKAAKAFSGAGALSANSVEIYDTNSGDATKAGTITKASVDGYTVLRFNGTGLTDLSVAHGSSNIIIDNAGLTAPTNTTLNLTANGLTGGTLDDANVYTQLNVTTGAEASTLNNITFEETTKLTVAGASLLTVISTAGLTALQTVKVSGAAGLAADLSGATVTSVDTSATTGASTLTLDGSKASFTGGAGVDTVTLRSADIGKAIDLGGGDDHLIVNTNASELAIAGAIDGGAGADTLTINATTGSTFVAPNNGVANIETLTIGNNAGLYANTVALAGLTQLNATGVGSVQLLAVATTDVKATVTGQQANAVIIDGGKHVTLTASGATTGAIGIGDNSAVHGAVEVSRETAGAVIAGAITVKGGTTVEIQQTATNAVNSTQTHGAVTINGGAATTQVTVKATKAATPNGATAGVTANTVMIVDVNAGKTTDTGTITKASVDGYTTLEFRGTALTDLSVAHGSGYIVIDNSGLTAPTNTTLNATVSGLTGGMLDDSDVYTTLNLTTGAEASTLADITFGALTTLNIDGASALTLTSAAGMTKLQTVKISDAAGVTASLTNGTLTAIDASGSTGTNTVTINPARANYTGGSGVDVLTFNSVTISRSFALGDGDDMMIFASGTSNFSNNSTLSGGGGIDTLKMTLTDARANGTPTFATNVTGFERLLLTSATGAHPINLANLGVHWVIVAGGNGMIMNNMNSGGTLELTGAGTAYTIANSAFTAGASDTINVKLTSGAGAGVAFATTGISAAGVETITLTNTDSQATPSGTFNNSVTLLGNDLKTLTVGGNAGLTLTAASTALTSVDASGLTKGGFTWTSGAIASGSTVKGSATGANIINLSAGGRVTYTGGAGDDQITLGDNGFGSELNLGGGANTVTSGTGGITITAGDGDDTVTVGSGNHTVNLGNGTNAFTMEANAYILYTGGTGADTITVGNAGHEISLGGGADKVIITSAGFAADMVHASITGFGADDQLTLRPASGVNAATGSIGAKITGQTTLQGYLDAATAGDGGATSLMRWFQLGTDTYVVLDNSAAGAFQSGVDNVVKLVGLADLSGWGVSGGVLSALPPPP